VSAQKAGAAVLEGSGLPAAGPRLLIVADTALADVDELPPLVRGVIDDAQAVHVVTPTLPGRLDWLASETNPARHAADERLDSMLAQVRSTGTRASGRTGDEDILTAFADAVAEFEPDHILIALRSSEHANWQERGLLARVRERFDLPLTTFAVDEDGHISGARATGPRQRTPVPNGTAVLGLFLLATLIVVGGVALAGAIDSWWVLAPVVAVDLMLTVAVTLSIFRMLRDDHG
jgi:hypothetical protein